MRIEIHLEHVVLIGIDLAAVERGLVGEAVRGELTRLLSATPSLAPNLAAGGAVAQLAGGSVRLGPGGAVPLGQSIGAAVHEGLVR